jgi:hypothetical protein
MLKILTPSSNRWYEFGDMLFQRLGCDLPGLCNGDYHHAKTATALMGGIDIEGSVAYFKKHGGYCDCEILLNVLPPGVKAQKDRKGGATVE